MSNASQRFIKKTRTVGNMYASRSINFVLELCNYNLQGTAKKQNYCPLRIMQREKVNF